MQKQDITYLCSLWLANSEPVYLTIKARAEALGELSEAEKVTKLSQFIRELILAEQPKVTGFYEDLISWALEEIDFDAVARDFLTE